MNFEGLWGFTACTLQCGAAKTLWLAVKKDGVGRRLDHLHPPIDPFAHLWPLIQIAPVRFAPFQTDPITIG